MDNTFWGITYKSRKIIESYVFSQGSLYPNAETFIFVEDDAQLIAAEQFVKEVGVAVQKQYQFYSFFLTGKQQQKGGEGKEPTCFYEHGTVAFLIRRRLMQTMSRLMKESRVEDWASTCF